MNEAAQSMTLRSPRVPLAEATPAVLRLPAGGSSRAKLKTISLTGGLLEIPTVLNHGSLMCLLFVSSAGPVLGNIEMLNAISKNQQAFRFVSLEERAQRRLRDAVDSLLVPVDPAWIVKYRAAMARRNSSA
jgi:hypothetical protein